jgi:hypothetical protein
MAAAAPAADNKTTTLFDRLKFTVTLSGATVKDKNDPFSVDTKKKPDGSKFFDVWKVEGAEENSLLKDVERFAWRIPDDKPNTVEGLLAFKGTKRKVFETVKNTLFPPQCYDPENKEFKQYVPYFGSLCPSDLKFDFERLTKEKFDSLWGLEQYNNHRKRGVISQKYDTLPLAARNRMNGMKSAFCCFCRVEDKEFDPSTKTKPCPKIGCG